MASELHVPVGTVPGYGADIEVCRHPDGSAAIWMGFTGASVSVPPESVAALAELIQRAAMPGQPLPQAAPTREEVDRCGYSEDPFHRCRVCYDYAAGQERDHPLTVAAVSEDAMEAMEALGQLADAAQEAAEDG